MRLFLVRHAPGLDGGCLAGRRDIHADCTDTAGFARQRARLPGNTTAIRSPALRCQQTAQHLGLGHAAIDPALWEQDYGAWEGLAYADLPDLGRLDADAIARHRPEGGESFLDVTARVVPALSALTDDTVVIAHAGTIRAALSMVIGPAALSFEIAPLSLTLMRRAGNASGGEWAVERVNIGARD